ncbi:NADPH:quinone reductase-like Zn-dependent oxidoreductase [Saccharothrix tamanrassetensis]|uniref:NADPH:quinone reductase-like Zn-dependent oxidoreductase n=1 Tax=Saccharothrix tamanrassetensis TaxID=1051531 RepID=A0A841CDC6_9PSEU|nr:NADP-dependent oxidoreductase [Saccharothrix tamanrassetensis]MBB5954364.1 NADPH:quinone reductase-like Zn-dependent oxidoreductase [Saccharothrix tamanrassetensis]
MTNIMRAAVIDAFGPADTLRLTDLPVPVPGEGEVLIRVHAAGINAIDWASRAGQGVGVSAFPAVLGWDLSGTVVTGTGVTGPQAGDEVFGMPRFPALAGAYAEYVVSPADEVVPKPDNVDHRTAAAAPMVGITAWQTLFRHAGLERGQRVLVHGAAGGVGHVAVQLAAGTGAEVVGTASARNHDFVAGLGASRVVDYTAERVEDVVRDIDVVVDTRGGDDAVRLLDVLRPGGILVTLKGQDDKLDATARERGLRTGYTYVSPDAEALVDIARRLADGSLRIALEQAFPLERVAAAHATGEEGHVRGRLVLDVYSASGGN